MIFAYHVFNETKQKYPETNSEQRFIWYNQPLIWLTDRFSNASAKSPLKCYDLPWCKDTPALTPYITQTLANF